MPVGDPSTPVCGGGGGVSHDDGHDTHDFKVKALVVTPNESLVIEILP